VYDSLGTSYLAGICQRDLGLAASIVQASEYDLEQTAIVAARELGRK